MTIKEKAFDKTSNFGLMCIFESLVEVYLLCIQNAFKQKRPSYQIGNTAMTGEPIENPTIDDYFKHHHEFGLLRLNYDFGNFLEWYLEQDTFAFYRDDDIEDLHTCITSSFAVDAYNYFIGHYDEIENDLIEKHNKALEQEGDE